MGASDKLGVLIKTSLVDYPGKVASVLFLSGCNLRCPYCYNIDLVNGHLDNNEAVSFEDVVTHLTKRRRVISGFVLSGGEALLSPYLPKLIRAAKDIGLSVKLDTNGMMPEKLAALLADDALCPDFVALDVKTSPERYSELVGSEVSKETAQKLSENIIKSIELIAELPQERREYRTVLVPPLVAEKDILRIAELLPKDASWQFAKFQNENCLNSRYNDIAPYLDKDLTALANLAKRKIKGAAIR